MRYQDLNIKLMIRRYGQELPHKKKVTTDIGDGDIEISYVLQSNKRGQVVELTALDTLVAKWGQRLEGDYLATFLPGTDIHEGDLLYVNGAWCEILEHPLDRCTGGVVDYMEAHLRRVK